MTLCIVVEVLLENSWALHNVLCTMYFHSSFETTLMHCLVRLGPISLKLWFPNWEIKELSSIGTSINRQGSVETLTPHILYFSIKCGMVPYIGLQEAEIKHRENEDTIAETFKLRPTSGCAPELGPGSAQAVKRHRCCQLELGPRWPLQEVAKSTVIETKKSQIPVNRSQHSKYCKHDQVVHVKTTLHLCESSE